MNINPSTRYCPPRAYNVLVFRKKGSAKLVHKKQSYNLGINNITFIPKGYDYTITTKTEEELIIIHFEAEIKNGKSFANIKTEHPERLFSLFEKSFVAWTQKPFGFMYKLDSLFSSILEMVERQSFETSATLIELSIQKAIDTMHIKISDSELTIEKLSAYTGYAPSYFRREFKRCMGISPIEYLIKIRIEYATSLLEDGYYTIEKVSELCGFKSTKYFSTSYKLHTGTSPSKIKPHVNK